MTICTICGIEAVAHGLCDKHYRRMRRNGSPDALRRPGSQMTVAERLALHSIRTESGCIEWTAAKNSSGYGQIKYNGKMSLAHRVAYEVAHGEIDASLCVMHSCDNPACINIAHLSLGTHQDNIADRTRKGRENPVQGSRHYKAKLTDADVLAIRADHRTQPVIAAQYGVSLSTIESIKGRRSWRHLP